MFFFLHVFIVANVSTNDEGTNATKKKTKDKGTKRHKVQVLLNNNPWSLGNQIGAYSSDGSC